MNRAEHANAVRDLLAIDVDAEALLPPDDASYFDNIADALTVSPAISLISVEFHKARIMKRLGVRSVAELIKYAGASGPAPDSRSQDR